MAQPPVGNLIPANSFIVEFDGGAMTSPHIHKVTGLSSKTGTVDIVDGGTNQKLTFSDGILQFGDITFVRARDGSADDAAFARFFDDVVATGAKKNGQLIQYQHGQEVLRINFKGLLFNERSLNDLSTESSDKSEISFQAKCDYWELEFTAI